MGDYRIYGQPNIITDRLRRISGESHRNLLHLARGRRARHDYERAEHERRLHERIRWRLRLGRSLLRHRTDWEAVNWTTAKRIAPLVEKAIFQKNAFLKKKGEWAAFFEGLRWARKPGASP